MAKTVSFAQLCAIATAVIRHDPTLDDSAWCEQIKRRLVQLRLAYPWPHDLTAAIRAVERAHGLSRLTRLPPVAPASEAPAAPLTHAEAAAILDDLAVTVRAVPRVRVPVLREVERRKALQLIAQGIVEQVQRCEDAERVVEEPIRQ